MTAAKKTLALALIRLASAIVLTGYQPSKNDQVAYSAEDCRFEPCVIGFPEPVIGHYGAAEESEKASDEKK